MTDQEPGPGHNQPPSEQATLFARARELVDNANRWRAERPLITDAEMAATAQRFIEQLRAIRADLRDKLDELLAPVRATEAATKMEFRDPLDLTDLALKGVIKANTEWLQTEKKRLDRERAQKERAAEAALIEATRLEEAARQAGASVDAELAASRARDKAQQLTEAAVAIPDRPRIKDDQSAKAMSLHSNWKARIIDEPLAVKSYGPHPDVKIAVSNARLAAITKVATSDAKKHRDQKMAKPGIEYFNDERAQ